MSFHLLTIFTCSCLTGKRKKLMRRSQSYSAIIHFEIRKEIPIMASAAINGIINKLSSHSVKQTVERLKNILQSKGIALFALVDHSGEAEKVGMSMLPSKLLIFGSPKAGTPLMLAAPSIAIDLLEYSGLGR
jgi:hypothetical protein